MHGKTSEVSHDGRGIFSGLGNPFTATRYHSLVIEPGSCPPELEVTARTAEGEIMAVRHRELPVRAVQFHPEKSSRPGRICIPSACLFRERVP